MSKLEIVLNAIPNEPFSNSYYNDLIEYVANSVDLFYDSQEIREKLEINNPTIYKLLLEIQDKAMNESQ